MRNCKILRNFSVVTFGYIVFHILLCQPARADFILDDFNDEVSSEMTPLESYRYYEDLFAPEFPLGPLSGSLTLQQNPGSSAELRYQGLGNYNLSQFNQLILRSAVLEQNVTATMEVNDIFVAYGEQSFNSNNQNILTFRINPDLVSIDKLSFFFTTTGDVPFSITSTALLGSPVQAVPEPTSILLVSTAFVCGAGYHRMRKRRAQKA